MNYQEAANELLGTPWNAENFHCYTCVQQIIEMVTGFRLPDQVPSARDTYCNCALLKNETQRSCWLDVSDRPRQVGDIVILGTEKVAYHGGIITQIEYAKCYVTHCAEKVRGVMTHAISDLPRAGWRVHGFYVFQGVTQ